MNYQTQSWDTKNISVDEAGIATFTVGIITEIVGNTYPQFIAGDTTNIAISGYAAKTGAQINTELTNAVHAFVATKYPNT